MTLYLQNTGEDSVSGIAGRESPVCETRNLLVLAGTEMSGRVSRAVPHV